MYQKVLEECDLNFLDENSASQRCPRQAWIDHHWILHFQRTFAKKHSLVLRQNSAENASPKANRMTTQSPSNLPKNIFLKSKHLIPS